LRSEAIKLKRENQTLKNFKKQVEQAQEIMKSKGYHVSWYGNHWLDDLAEALEQKIPTAIAGYIKDLSRDIKNLEKVLGEGK